MFCFSALDKLKSARNLPSDRLIDLLFSSSGDDLASNRKPGSKSVNELLHCGLFAYNSGDCHTMHMLSKNVFVFPNSLATRKYAHYLKRYKVYLLLHLYIYCYICKCNNTSVNVAIHVQ